MGAKTNLRYLRKRPKTLSGLIIALILTAIGFVAAKQPDKPAFVAQQNPGNYQVVEFYDGDTVSVNMNGTTEKVRFIGVDTPETHDPRKEVQCFGQAAAQYTKDLIGTQEVRLDADPTNQNRDRYNRLLRYVYLPDGRQVNAEIIKNGYGFAYTSFPFQKLEEFRALQVEAREQNRGLWSTCTPTENEFGGYTSNNATQ